jgi:RNA polymerase sigma-70 factor (ECF subfamily)
VPTEIEQLYREHRAGLVRLVERELHDRHEAEDVVQTAFVDAQRALERGTVPRNPPAWLAAIALNAGRRLRRRHQNAEPLEDYAVEEAAAIPEIRAALASLPREQRTAVVYRDVLGLSYDETAEQMGVTVNAVTMLLHRGRRRLRKSLGVTAAGLGLSRWLRRAGMPQVAVAKGAAAVVATGCLATTGIVVARVTASIGSDAAAVATDSAGSGGPVAQSGGAFGGTPMAVPAHRRFATGSVSSVSAMPAASIGVIAAPASTQSSTGGATVVSVPASTTTAPRSLLPPTLPLPTVSVPTVSIPAVTMAVTTPVATVTVAAPTVTTATVTTPIVTVTLPTP